MLLQANDYLWLHDHEGCELQIGGSDQWGNILVGRRPDPPASRGRPSTPWLAAAHRAGRHEARQDDGRPDLARPGPRPARTSSSSTGCRPTTARSRQLLAQFTLLPVAEVDERRRRRTSEAAPSAASAQRRPGPRGHGAGPRRRRGGRRRGGRAPSCSGARSPTHRRRRSRPGGRRGARSTLDGPTLAERPRRGRRLAEAAGSPARRARPAGPSPRAALYVNDERVADGARVTERPAPRRWVLLRRGKKAHAHRRGAGLIRDGRGADRFDLEPPRRCSRFSWSHRVTPARKSAARLTLAHQRRTVATRLERALFGSRAGSHRQQRPTGPTAVSGSPLERAAP